MDGIKYGYIVTKNVGNQKKRRGQYTLERLVSDNSENNYFISNKKLEKCFYIRLLSFPEMQKILDGLQREDIRFTHANKEESIKLLLQENNLQEIDKQKYKTLQKVTLK